MSLFDIFTFKKEGKKIFNSSFFIEIFGVARKEIIKNIQKNIPGEEKKKQVDIEVITAIYNRVQLLNIKNKVVLWLVNELVEAIPVLTQLIYNFLKEKIENL